MKQQSTNALFSEELNTELLQHGFLQKIQGRYWLRTLDGNEWHLRLSSQSRTRYSGDVRVREFQGLRIRIEIRTKLGVRAYFVRRDFTTNRLVKTLYRLRKFKVLAVEHPEDALFCVVCSDETWIRQFLSLESFRIACPHLLSYRHAPGACASFFFEPHSINFTSHLVTSKELDKRNFRTLLTSLQHITLDAQKIPPPSNPARLNWIEETAQRHPALAGIAFFVAILIFLFLLVAIPLSFAFLILR